MTVRKVAMHESTARRKHGILRLGQGEKTGRFTVKIVTCRAGAGHTQVAAALADALDRHHPDRVSTHIVDAVKDYSPFPYNFLPELYAHWCQRAPTAYGWGHRLTDGRRRTEFLLKATQPWVRRGMRKLLADPPADVVVCVHSLENHLLTWARRAMKLTTPFVTIVTDPFSAHAVWMAPEADRVLVGSEEARGKAMSLGIAPERVKVTGHLVNTAFIEHLLDPPDAKAVLGWNRDKPGVLLVGGGDGVGSIEKHAMAIDDVCRGIQIAVVTGRNRRLMNKLQTRRWNNLAHVYGFVDHVTEMSLLMSAADILVTKAGPGTLHDAYLAGLPIILSGSIPRQEDGNVTQVVSSGAGVWASRPRDVAELTRDLFWKDRRALARMATRSSLLAQPHAAEAAADEVWRLLMDGPAIRKTPSESGR